MSMRECIKLYLGRRLSLVANVGVHSIVYVANSYQWLEWWLQLRRAWACREQWSFQLHPSRPSECAFLSCWWDRRGVLRWRYPLCDCVCVRRRKRKCECVCWMRWEWRGWRWEWERERSAKCCTGQRCTKGWFFILILLPQESLETLN